MTTALRIVLLVVALLVTCSAVGPGDLSVVPATASIQVGQSVQLQAVQDGRVVNAQWSSSQTSVAMVTSTGLVTGRAAGESVITARKGRWLASAVVMVSGGSTPPPSEPPPVSDSHRGPQPTITCPAGAVDILPSQSIQSIVNAHAAGTAFCLRAGIHQMMSPVTPRSGDTFAGEYGAILDGTGWTTSVLEMGAFRAHDQDINDVTIRNLVIRNMPQRGIHTWSSTDCSVKPCVFTTAGADRWVIEHNEIMNNAIGLQVSNEMVVRRNRIHHNVGPDPCGANTLLRGSNLVNYATFGAVIEDNEFSHGGCEGKFGSITHDTVFRGNWVHHELGNAVWTDGGVTNTIELNVIEDNAAIGIFYEAGGAGVIRHNTIRRNGANGIQVSTSHSLEMSSNTLEDNVGGIIYYVECERVFAEEGGYIDDIYMQDVSAVGNSVSVSTQSGAYANGLSYSSACSSSQLQPYLNGSHNLTFTDNAYVVPNVSGSYWLWGGPMVTWASWQTLGHDSTGTVQGR